MPCGFFFVGFGRLIGMLAIVSFVILESFRFAPSIAMPMGIPCPLVSRLRFAPCLARSVGLGPHFFPRKRRFRHRPVQGLPFPVDPFKFVIAGKPFSPYCEKHSRLNPFLKTAVRRGRRTQPGFVERIPLASRAEDEEDCIHRPAVGDARPATAKRMRFRRLGEKRLYLLP